MRVCFLCHPIVQIRHSSRMFSENYPQNFSFSARKIKMLLKLQFHCLFYFYPFLYSRDKTQVFDLKTYKKSSIPTNIDGFKFWGGEWVQTLIFSKERSQFKDLYCIGELPPFCLKSSVNAGNI